jgi:glycosyltransferase involved in cell wall biosynthesis
MIFSQHFWPESFRINDVAHALKLAGHEVFILTGQPNYPGPGMFKGYRAWRAGQDQFQGMTVYRVPLVPRGKGGAIRLALNYLSFIASSTLIAPWLLRRRACDMIFVYATSPLLQAIGAIVLAKLKGARLCIWVQDLWPESLQATGFVKNRHALAMVGKVVRWIYHKADLLLVQSEAMVDSVTAMAPMTPVRYHPNPGDKIIEQAGTGQPALTLDTGFNVVFAGNLGTIQSLETVMAAAEILANIPDIRLVLIGSGSRSQWLATEVARRRLSNVQLPGRFPPEAMPGLLAQASALLVSLTKSPIFAQTVPSKLQAYLAAGKPIIASLDGEGARVVTRAGAGVCCPAEDATALAQAVISLYRQPEITRQEMGQAGMNYYAEHYEPGILAMKLTELLDDVLRTEK